MESQPQNPEFRINLENFHPCIKNFSLYMLLRVCVLIWSNLVRGLKSQFYSGHCENFHKDSCHEWVGDTACVYCQWNRFHMFHTCKVSLQYVIYHVIADTRLFWKTCHKSCIYMVSLQYVIFHVPADTRSLWKTCHKSCIYVASLQYVLSHVLSDGRLGWSTCRMRCIYKVSL